MKFSNIIHFLLLTVLLPAPLFAVEANPLYSIDVHVENQTFIKRKAAIRSAFDQIVLRLTGSKQSLESPVLVDAHRKVSRWVAQFSYRQEDIEGPGDVILEANILRIDFDPEAIDQLLLDAGYESWLAPRNVTAIALEFYGFAELGFAEDSFFLEEQRQQWKTLIEEMGQRYALPVRFSAWTAVAEQELSMTALAPQKKVFYAAEEPIADEASRVLTEYEAPSVLLGRLSLDRQGQWQTRWQHYLNGEMVHLFDKGEAAEIIDRLGLQLTGRLREYFFNHRVIQEEGHVLLNIRGITQLTDFQEAENLLNNIKHITSMRVSSIHEDEVIYELDVVGGKMQLQEDLSIYKQLRAVEILSYPSDINEVQIPTGLIFQWGE